VPCPSLSSTQPDMPSSLEQPTHASQEVSESSPVVVSGEVQSMELAPKNVCHAPLPLGHEPPPGFSCPASHPNLRNRLRPESHSHLSLPSLQSCSHPN
jgi:hypothetical protein